MACLKQTIACSFEWPHGPAPHHPLTCWPAVLPPPPLLQIVFAREYLQEVFLGEKQAKYLVEEARRGGVQVRWAGRGGAARFGPWRC